MNMAHQAPQTPVPTATTSPQNLDDDALASWLEQRYRAKHSVGYLYGQYLCKVVNLDDNTCPLLLADPDKKGRNVLRKLANRGHLKTLTLPVATLNTSQALDPTWSFTPISADDIVTKVNERLQLLGRAVGRGQPISEKTAWQVWADAGGRCMFAGCGTNLAGIPLYNAPARIGYLAHIIASDPNGPRGTLADSHQRSDDPSNIMLMCDGHHRLIDSFAPDDYPADRLVAMRQNHQDLVNRYLGALAYPRAKAIAIHANLGNISTDFPDSAYIDAILAIDLSMQPGVLHYIRRTQRDDRRTPAFWVQYLHEHELQIQQMVNSFNHHGALDSDELAVFPLHHIATMILAGRIIGEARQVHVFQYHRQRSTWEWDPNAAPQPAGTFNVTGLTEGRADEALITLELTAHVDDAALPVHLAEAITAGRMPWVRISMTQPDGACIRHPDDIAQFMATARQAINHAQDVMRVNRVHLIAISPASTVFCFGQMLQAGHHPTYTIYDRAGRDTPFCEAFSISGHEVTASAGNLTKTIPIR